MVIEKNEFRVCKCGNAIPHGYVYFTNDKCTDPIFSLNYARIVLELVEKDGLITPVEKNQIIESIKDAGVTEEGPDKDTIDAYKHEQEKYESDVDSFLQMLGLSKNDLIVLKVEDRHDLRGFDVDIC